MCLSLSIAHKEPSQCFATMSPIDLLTSVYALFLIGIHENKNLKTNLITSKDCIPLQSNRRALCLFNWHIQTIYNMFTNFIIKLFRVVYIPLRVGDSRITESNRMLSYIVCSHIKFCKYFGIKFKGYSYWIQLVITIIFFFSFNLFQKISYNTKIQ